MRGSAIVVEIAQMVTIDRDLRSWDVSHILEEAKRQEGKAVFKMYCLYGSMCGYWPRLWHCRDDEEEEEAEEEGRGGREKGILR